MAYTVQLGEKLWIIAKRFGASYKSLAGWNSLDIEGIRRLGRNLVALT